MASQSVHSGPRGENGVPVEKKTYAKPKLTRLGSVRELTLGGGFSAPESKNMTMKSM